MKLLAAGLSAAAVMASGLAATPAHAVSNPTRLGIVFGQPGPRVMNRVFHVYVQTYRGVSCRMNGGTLVRNTVRGGTLAFALVYRRPGTYRLNLWCSAGRIGAGVNRTVTVIDPNKVIYLTFDDGPARATPLVLAELKKYGAKATFFTIGRMARVRPDLVQRIAADGHQLANHSYNHHDLRTLSNAGIRREIAATQSVLGRHASRCMRPPYGSTNPRVARVIAGLGMKQTLWNISTADWRRPSPIAISNAVTSRAFSGAVVLMHDGGGDGDNTAAALRILLPKLRAMGYRMVAMPC